jgi:predicted AlkP superfamily phosphohydrolase/phosphomutase
VAKPKIIIFGVDGGTFTIIKPLIKEGKLPNFAKLMNEGCYGDLESTIQPITPHAWTSFMTGRNAGKHGIYDFFERKPGSYDLHYSSNATRQGRTIWQIMSIAGKKVGLLNVPWTYPPEAVNGFVIAGLGTPGKNSNFIYPAALMDEIIKKFGDYKLLDMDKTQTREKYIKFQHEIVEETVELAKYLIDTNELDLFMVVFMGADHLQHMFWYAQDKNHPLFNEEGNRIYGKVVAEIYEKIDWALGELRQYLPAETNYIVMSDHGFGPTKKIIHLHKWLEQEELLKFQDPKIIGGMFQNTISRLKSLLLAHLPRKWKDEAKRIFPFLRGRIDSYIAFSGIDWSKTKAYAWGSYGNIIINLKGREPAGVVEPGEEYEALCDYITEQLTQLRDPDSGEPVVERVYRKEELYHGDLVEKAPDLIIVYKDYAYFSLPRLQYEPHTQIFVNPSDDKSDKMQASSYHTLNGICMLKGEGIKQHAELKGISIMDLSPTVLYMLDIPIPREMDGRVITEAFQPDVVNAKKLAFEEQGGIETVSTVGVADGDPFNETDKKAIEEKLKGLGYLE